MNRTEAPAKQPKPFGVNGQREPLLTTTPSGDNTASYEQGFPPITMTLKSAGGLPPKGQDMNQILFELSSLARWSSTGALNTFDSSFSASINGYPSGSIILSDDGNTIYVNTTDGNTANPNFSVSGWKSLTTYLGLGDVLHKGDGRLLAGTFVSTTEDAKSIGSRSATGCQFMRAYKAPDAPDQSNYWQVIVLPETVESSGRVSCLAMSGNDIHLGNGDASGISTWTILSGRQPASDTLTALSGLATGANQLPYFTGIGTVSQTPLTQMGRDIIGLTSVADALSYLGISSNLVPVGVPLPWPLAAPPSGWLLCNGQTFTAEQYPALAVAYPGLATPDLRGLFIRGLDNGRGYDPFRGLGTEQIDAFASHRHQPDQTTVGNRFVADYSESGSGSGAQITMGSNNYAMCRYTNYVGGTETRPRNFALNYIVRAA